MKTTYKTITLLTLILVLFQNSVFSFSIFQTIQPFVMVHDNEEVEIVPSFPPDAVASFAKPLADDLKEKLPLVYIKSSTSEKIWLAEPKLVTNPPDANLNTDAETPAPQTEVFYLGFVVPQLEAGAYTAWYGNEKPSEATDSLDLKISPILTPRKGAVTDNPSEKVQIEVGISSTFTFEKGSEQPKSVSVPIRLKSLNPQVADIVSGQDATLNTDKDGFAAWKIEIKSEGVAEFVAESNNFEPAQILVIGKPKAPQPIESAEESLEKAETSTAKVEDKLKIAEEKVDSQKIKTIRSGGNSSEMKVLIDRLRDFKSLEAQTMISRQTESMERAKLASVAAVSFSEKDLQPGDVLLVNGNSPISWGIRMFEKLELGAPADYSHAALYIGEINGVKMAAEMLAGGYKLNSLEVTRSGSIYVDVFRWRGITAAQANQIAQAGKTVCGDPLKFLASRNTCKPYAYEQITFLGATALGTTPTQLKASAVDLFAGGSKKMICSELVARIYEKVGLTPQVGKWWRAFETSGILNSIDRRADYTTPNMLAKSSKFERRGRLSN